MTPQETDWDLPIEHPGVSSRDMGQWWPAAGLGALNVTVPAWDLLNEVTIIFITFTIIWPQVNNREGTQLHSSIENWIRFTEHGPVHQNKTQFPLSQSLPSGSFHKPLVLLHQRADRLKTTVTEN